MIKVHNSLTKSVSEFTPLKEGSVGIYSCGPTVYDHVHIGNLRSFIFADSLRRAFELDGYKVSHVMNLTDVDDKTIKRSRSEFNEDSPEVALSKLTGLYEKTFMEDSASVGNDISKIEFIKATESIELMQDLILKLLAGKYAYIAEDGIYFSIEAYTKSGKKYGQLLQLDIDNTSKARINNDEYDKNSTHDFALWKLSRENEPAWPFEIDGKDYLGRPGWHIECSAMSVSKLGQPFDIHTGGIDLIFPHHENEIAQSTASEQDESYAKYFMHNEHLLVDQKKMSKSLDNFFNLTDLKEREFKPLAYRLFTLQSHYSSQANFSWDLLMAASIRLLSLQNMAALRFQPKEGSANNLDFGSIKNELKIAYLDNLDTPKVLALLSEHQNVLEDKLISPNQVEEFNDFLGFLDHMLGLDLLEVPDINDEAKALIKRREAERGNKQWDQSDQTRKELLDHGITLNDTNLGSIWSHANL